MLHDFASVKTGFEGLRCCGGTSGARRWSLGYVQPNSVSEVDKPMSQSGSFAVEEHVHGDTVWVAIRARGAEWSWLTPQEAARLGREWVEKYGATDRRPATPHLVAAE